MSDLPEKYSYLDDPESPPLIKQFIKIYGITEVPGVDDNPVILAWAREVQVDNVYKHDATPWCGLTMGILASRCGYDYPLREKMLWALNWTEFGKKVNDGAGVGDVLVFRRMGGGHVGLYVGEDLTGYYVAGGNESDKVNIVRIEKPRLVGARRPVGLPEAKKVRLTPGGSFSTDEK